MIDQLADHVVEDIDGLGGEAPGGAHGRGSGAGAGVVGAEDEAEGIDEEQARHSFMVHELAKLPHPKGKVLQKRHGAKLTTLYVS